MKFMRQSSKINWINTIVVLALRNMYEIDDSLEIIKGDTIKRHLPTSSGTDSILRRHAIKKWHTRRLIRSSRGLPMILHAEPHTREPRAREGVIYLNLANMWGMCSLCTEKLESTRARWRGVVRWFSKPGEVYRGNYVCGFPRCLPPSAATPKQEFGVLRLNEPFPGKWVKLLGEHDMGPEVLSGSRVGIDFEGLPLEGLFRLMDGIGSNFYGRWTPRIA